MKTKIKYFAPTIELIKLDNEISLALESNPPAFPGEDVISQSQEYNLNNAFKENNLV